MSKSTHRNPVIWFLVVDTTGAQVYARNVVKTRIPMRGNKHHYKKTVEQDLVPVAGMAWKLGSAEDSQIGNNFLERVFENVNTVPDMNTIYAYIQENRNTRFIHTIVSQLEISHRQKSFDRLVLIAPSRLLDELKKQLDENLLCVVVAELQKELTKYKGREQAEKLKK